MPMEGKLYRGVNGNIYWSVILFYEEKSLME